MRIKLLYKLDGLLNICKTCERKREFNNTVSPEVICKGCSNYEEIRKIGESLGGEKRMARAAFEMKVSDYLELRAEMNKREIAKHLGISEGTLYSWINKNENEINARRRNTQPTTAEKKPSETKTTPTETDVNTAEYESLKVQLYNQKQITEIQARQVEKLQADLQEAGEVCKRLNSEAAELRNKVEELENVNAACDDVENEVASLQGKYNQLRNEYDIAINKQYHLDYTVANQKKRIEDLGKTLERYELENRAMRELLRQWI